MSWPEVTVIGLFMGFVLVNLVIVHRGKRAPWCGNRKGGRHD